jgi:AmiR/NasT family two-component response regulator
LGAFDFYRDRPGPLASDDVAGALALAEAATRLVLDIVADSPPGWLPKALEHATQERSPVHEATGMVSVQLQVGIEEALAILRAHAWASGRPLVGVAADVVARRLRFDP